MIRKKYAAVGTGGRIPMFIDPIVDTYRESCQLVGLCDPSATRRSYHKHRLSREYGIAEIPDYEDFGRMLREQKPEVVIVCTPDCLHHQYIVRALEAGADVISEKPLTIDAGKCGEIFSAIERTRGKVRTTFNMRWTPGITKVRELIAAGEIGRIKHVDFEFFLNTSHGADYFRRWHSQKEVSGGLLLHKSTHHLDVINWWIDGIPSLVFAMGGLVFYGKENAVARGQGEFAAYPRYTGVAMAEKDPFRLTIDDDLTMRELYFNAESETGYIRDQNVFREGIDIEDSMSLLIKYRGGTMVNYSLNAFCPEEGFRASISGDAGRIEYVEKHASHIVTADREVRAREGDYSMKLRMQKHFSEAQEMDIPIISGSHGGGDALIQEQMFSPQPPPDSLRRNAGHEQGAASLLIGAAGNLSMASGNSVRIDDLLLLNPEARSLSQLI